MAHLAEIVLGDINTGFMLIDEINEANEDGLLPDKAVDFAGEVSEKLASVREFINVQGRVSEAQSKMVSNIVQGLERWVENVRK